MMIWALRISTSRPESTRAMVSLGPPAAYGTTRVIGLVGHSCAAADGASTARATAAVIASLSMVSSLGRRQDCLAGRADKIACPALEPNYALTMEAIWHTRPLLSRHGRVTGAARATHLCPLHKCKVT